MDNSVKKYYYNSPVGRLLIAEKQDKICRISFEDITNGEIKETPLINKTCRQLNEYFNKKRKVFDIPLLFEGSEFQIKVWKALTKIPYGKTISYKDTAVMIGNPKASRAVGGANNKNKIIIVVPCHRVIGANGDLTGYAGGLNVKKYLLDLEKS